MKVPPTKIWPENTKQVSGACQSYFIDKFIGNGSFQFSQDIKELVVWLLHEIAQKEKEAERSLMHRFNIATHLTWNKNYNVKPRRSSMGLKPRIFQGLPLRTRW
ncbi:hypothetical protein K1719_030753 [Acacia pycnantha]|nr:hypothetical protein K1719_030753 [Acacia pycnantha]